MGGGHPTYNSWSISSWFNFYELCLVLLKSFVKNKKTEKEKKDMCAHASYMRAHARVPKTIKGKFFAFNVDLEWIPHHLGVTPNSYFWTI